MAQSKGKPQQETGGKIRNITITPHGNEGFSVQHDHNQEMRGEYKEPKTHIMKTHGEMVQHVHDAMKSSGEQGADCPICSPADDDSKGEK